MNEITLKEKAYQTIKQKIMNCEYMPGEFFNEKQIIEEINVSRTPIRESIILLEQEGLVSIIPKRGVVVSPITVQDVIQAFEVRILIEPYIIKKYGSIFDKDLFTRYRKELTDPELYLDQKKGNIMDDDIHTAIVRASNNHYFLNVVNEIRVQNHRVRVLLNREVKRFLETVDEHLKVIDAILEEDYDKAAESMAEHLGIARDITIKNITLMKI